MENDYLKITRDTIIQYVANHSLLLTGNDELDKRVSEYIVACQRLVLSEGYARLYQLNFDEDGVNQLWGYLRDNDHYAEFVIQLTSILKMKFKNNEIGWGDVSEACVESMTLRTRLLTKGSKQYDETFVSRIPNHNTMVDLIKSNDWLVTLILINLTGPIRFNG